MKITGFTLWVVILFLVFSAFFIVWSIHLIPMQIKFMDGCEKKCSGLMASAKTEFASMPWNNLNGRCFCTITSEVTVAKICAKYNLQVLDDSQGCYSKIKTENGSEASFYMFIHINDRRKS